jgi:hypothetical protein
MFELVGLMDGCRSSILSVLVIENLKQDNFTSLSSVWKKLQKTKSTKKKSSSSLATTQSEGLGS